MNAQPVPHSFPDPGHASLFGYLFERAVALIVEETVFAVARYVDVLITVIVIIAHAHALSPSGRYESGLHGDVGEGAVMVVVEEMVGGLEIPCCSFCRLGAWFR